MTEGEYKHYADLHRGWLRDLINQGDKAHAANIVNGILGARGQYSAIPAAYAQNHTDIHALAVEVYKADSSLWKLAELLQNLGLKLQVVDAANS